MTKKIVGMRVYAILESTEEEIHLVGFGTYVGERSKREREPDGHEMNRARRLIERNDERPIQLDRAIRRMHDTTQISDEEIELRRREYLARWAAERERDIDERARELIAACDVSACLRLDNGRTVWGSEVLWGPEEKWDKIVAGRRVVTSERV